MSGPGYWPLNPNISNERPSMVRRTSCASSSRRSPSASVFTSRGRASGTREMSAAVGRYGSTEGRIALIPGIIGRLPMGGMRHVASPDVAGTAP